MNGIIKKLTKIHIRKLFKKRRFTYQKSKTSCLKMLSLKFFGYFSFSSGRSYHMFLVISQRPMIAHLKQTQYIERNLMLHQPM